MAAGASVWVGMGGSLCPRRGRGAFMLSLWDPGVSPRRRMGILQMPICCLGGWCPEPAHWFFLRCWAVLRCPMRTAVSPWALPSRPETCNQGKGGESHAGVTMRTTQAARDPGSHGAPAGRLSRWVLPTSTSSGTRKAGVPGAAATLPLAPASREKAFESLGTDHRTYAHSHAPGSAAGRKAGGWRRGPRGRPSTGCDLALDLAS